MQVVIRGRQLPGRSFQDGELLRQNVHVGLQVGREPKDLVPGDAAAAEWRTEVEIVVRDGVRDFRGPAVQGKRGERFLYLTWGEVDGGSFAMFRRAKLMLEQVPLLDQLSDRAVAVVELTDAKGGPICARLREPYLRWESLAG